jgi:hypothetical protein
LFLYTHLKVFFFQLAGINVIRDKWRCLEIHLTVGGVTSALDANAEMQCHPQVENQMHGVRSLGRILFSAACGAFYYSLTPNEYFYQANMSRAADLEFAQNLAKGHASEALY